MNIGSTDLTYAGLEIARSIVRSLRSTNFLPVVYPALYNKGISGGAFHPYMVSALLLLGDRLGYSPVCDSPIFDRLDLLLTDEGRKRPDSVWFERGTETARVLIEFERFTSTSLQHKARNLLLMANAHKDEIKLLTLIYWTTEVRPIVDLQLAKEIFTKGFLLNGSKYSQPLCPVLILETKVLLKANHLTIDSFITRQLISQGENKHQMVNELNQ